MALSFCSFSSGSSGNCYLIKNENTAVLVDAGISCKRILEGLNRSGVDKDMVKAIFITHEHSDHILSLSALSRKLANAKVYVNSDTLEKIKDRIPEEKQVVFQGGETIDIEGIQALAFYTSHDSVNSQSYRFESDGKKICILTDTGVVNEEMYAVIKEADLLVLEANYEEEVLLHGSYPYFLKRRILGEYGHLSNVAAAETIVRMMSEDEKERRILLAHLSKENNTPDLAFQTVKNYLEEKGVYISDKLKLGLLLRDCMSNMYNIF